jgi:hypothetical protein
VFENLKQKFDWRLLKKGSSPWIWLFIHVIKRKAIPVIGHGGK